MDLKKEVEKFRLLSGEQKISACLTVLGGSKNRGGIFSELYEIVSNGKASEKTLSDIYESALAVLEEADSEKTEESIRKLEAAKEELGKRQETERTENIKENRNAEEAIAGIL